MDHSHKPSDYYSYGLSSDYVGSNNVVQTDHKVNLKFHFHVLQETLISPDRHFGNQFSTP